MTDPTGNPAERRFAAVRACDRQLSGPRPLTLRERIADLYAGAEADHDLDVAADMYGDGVVLTLEKTVSELLGKEDAAFFPTGTMAQQAALRCWAEKSGNSTVAMHPTSHLELHERHAYNRLSGLRSIWPTAEPRMPTPAEIAAVPEPFGTLLLELPMRTVGFVLPTWDELTATVAAARERGAVVHFDGARLWESTFHLGRSLPEIAQLADSVYVSCYKTLGGISGALLAGPAPVIAQAKAWRHRYGGQLFQQWPVVLTALAGLRRELPRLQSYVDHAKTVAAVLDSFPGARVHPQPPHTHQFQLWLPYPAERLNQVGLEQMETSKTALFGTWREGALPGFSYCEVTIAEPALAWTGIDVRTAMQEFLAPLGQI
jgi:threonine aldolase